MSYAPEVKELAFEYYCFASSNEAVAERLRATRGDCGNMNAKTVARWEKDLGWAERKQNVLNRRAELADDKRVDRVSDLLESIDEMIDAAIIDVKEKPLLSREGGVRVIKTLIDLRDRLMGIDKDRMLKDVRRSMSMVRQAMEQIPAFANLMTPENMNQLADNVEKLVAETKAE